MTTAPSRGAATIVREAHDAADVADARAGVTTLEEVFSVKLE